MLASYRSQQKITSKGTKKAKNDKIDNNSHREHDLERPQMTSKGFKRLQMKIVRKKTQNNLKGGFVQKNVEINEHFLDEILHKNNS